MANIIDAITSLVNAQDFKLKDYKIGNNRANNMGEALEEYVKDLFASSSGDDETERMRKLSEAFSYFGNTNNPPDAMLRGGDAIEVKKLESLGSELALNSSYPKHKLFASSSRVTDACRDSEDWVEKDIIYAVGWVQSGILRHLSFVYGQDYAANREAYTDRLFLKLQKSIKEIPNFDFVDSKELGRVNKVDPLGITYLRIRGMWHIQNPLKVFSYVYVRPSDAAFSAMCIINGSKWDELGNTHELEALADSSNSLNIENVAIKNPDNPAKLIAAKLITINIKEHY